MEENSRINSSHHPILAMLALRAIKPDRLRIHDANRIREKVSSSYGRSVRGHETGVEGVGFVGHDVLDGDAGLVEGRLDDGVVLVSTINTVLTHDGYWN